MFIRSFERVWEVSSPIEESNFWRQRAVAINSAAARASYCLCIPKIGKYNVRPFSVQDFHAVRA